MYHGTLGGTTHNYQCSRLYLHLCPPISSDICHSASQLHHPQRITTLPSNLDPPLQGFANSSEAKALFGMAYFQSCDAYLHTEQAASPSPCFFGDLQSDKTIVLVGDSNVGNWAPALDLGLKEAGYRLAVFAFPGCGTPDLNYASFGTLNSSLLGKLQ